MAGSLREITLGEIEATWVTVRGYDEEIGKQDASIKQHQSRINNDPKLSAEERAALQRHIESAEAIRKSWSEKKTGALHTIDRCNATLAQLATPSGEATFKVIPSSPHDTEASQANKRAETYKGQSREQVRAVLVESMKHGLLCVVSVMMLQSQNWFSEENQRVVSTLFAFHTGLELIKEYNYLVARLIGPAFQEAAAPKIHAGYPFPLFFPEQCRHLNQEGFNSWRELSEARGGAAPMSAAHLSRLFRFPDAGEYWGIVETGPDGTQRVNLSPVEKYCMDLRSDVDIIKKQKDPEQRRGGNNNERQRRGGNAYDTRAPPATYRGGMQHQRGRNQQRFHPHGGDDAASPPSPGN